MERFVITFARGFGTGGKEIASRLAKELGIHCYENRILTVAAQLSGLDEKLFDEVNEKIRSYGGFSSFLRGLPRSRHYISRNETFVSDDTLFAYQKQIIENLADTESCVIVGRCANYILRNYPNVMSVFVHAPHEFCMRQAMMRSSMTEREMEKFIAKTDKYRGEYHKYCTGLDWEESRHYDLCLNSSKLGFEKCKEEILSYRKIRFGVD